MKDPLDAMRNAHIVQLAAFALLYACQRALRVEEAHLIDIKESWGPDFELSPDYQAATQNAECYRSAIALALSK